MARLVAVVLCLVAAGSAAATGERSSPPATWDAEHATLLSPMFGYAEVGWQGGTEAHPTYGGGFYLYRDSRWSKTIWGGIDDAAFPDRKHGWIATYDCALALVSVYRTVDGGETWRRLPVRASHSCGGGPSYLSFPNRHDGWLEPVSPNGPGGYFVRTTNGGRSWFGGGNLGGATPGAACLRRITALSAAVAWMPCGQLLGTVDGGRTWHPQVLPLPARWRRRTVTSAGDPRFFGRHGVVTLTAWSRHGKAVLFYASSDGGGTWSLRGARRAAGFCARGFPWPSSPQATTAIASPTTWWLVSNQLGRIDVTHDAGRHWASHASSTLRRLGWCDITSITAGSPSLAWVTTKQRRTTALYATHDAGRTWRPVKLPLR